MIFLNIKIIRVIYSTVGHTGKVTAARNCYRDSEEFTREQRLYSLGLNAKIN